jgi:hypothetical protein
VRYLNGGQWTLLAEYVETESGRHSDRPKLAAALSHAKAIGAKLVFAKLDRLTRNVDLPRLLVASGIDFVFCDLLSVPSRSYGPLSAYPEGRRCQRIALAAGVMPGLIVAAIHKGLNAFRKTSRHPRAMGRHENSVNGSVTLTIHR